MCIRIDDNHVSSLPNVPRLGAEGKASKSMQYERVHGKHEKKMAQNVGFYRPMWR